MTRSLEDIEHEIKCSEFGHAVQIGDLVALNMFVLIGAVTVDEVIENLNACTLKSIVLDGKSFPHCENDRQECLNHFTKWQYDVNEWEKRFKRKALEVLHSETNMYTEADKAFFNAQKTRKI